MVQNVLDSVPLLKKVGQIRKSEFLDSGIHPSMMAKGSMTNSYGIMEQN